MIKYIEVTWSETRRVVVAVDDEGHEGFDFEDRAYTMVHSEGWDEGNDFVDQGETTYDELDEKDGKARAVN